MSSAPFVDRTLGRARSLARNGEFMEAHRLCRAVLERFPDNRRAADVLKTLCEPTAPRSGAGARRRAAGLANVVSLQAAGHLVDAVREGETLARDFPQDARIAFVVGAVHLAAGHLREAVAWNVRALRLRPTFTKAYNNLGNALQRLGRLEEAIASYGEAVRLDPDFAQAYANLGAALLDHGAAERALVALQRAISLQPRKGAAYNGLGSALRELGRYEEAVAVYRAGIAVDPEDARLFSNLGNALRQCERYQEAIEAYHRALALRPEFADCLNNLGVALGETGRAEEARRYYRAALAIAPDYAEVHRHLSLVTTYRRGDPHLAEMHALEAGQAGPVDEVARMHLSFALAKAYDDLDERDRSFAYLVEANRLRKRLHPYDGEAVVASHAALRAFFDVGKVNAALPLHAGPPGAGEADGPTPIFIVGMPRSGSTLVEQILSSHSMVSAAGEVNALDRALALVSDPLKRASAATVADELLLDIRRGYLRNLPRPTLDRPFVTDKMLVNYRWVGFIAMALPHARIIHTRREAVATCWSIFRHYFASRGNGYAYDMGDVAHYYGAHLELMTFWQERFPGRIHTLDYDRLVDDQEGETRRLLAHCGLPWEDACLTFHRTERAVRTASADQVRRRLYTGSSRSWRRYEHHLAPMIAALAG